MLYVWIAVFGAVGSLARYGAQNLFLRTSATDFPLGTFLVNVTGSFLVGFIARVGVGEATMSHQLRTGLLVGLCGGYTTFSTFSIETVRLMEEGAWGKAMAYIAGSLLLSLAATAAGIQAGNRVGI